MSFFNGKLGQPMRFDDLTKVEGSLKRHVEQLWDEIHRLKEEVKVLKEKIK